MTTGFRDNLYQFLSDHINAYGMSPSFREITEAMGISPRSKSFITRSLRTLEKEGKLILEKKGRRLLIKISNKQLQLLGRISAGSPIEAIEDRQFIDINQLFSGEDRCALTVKGASMIDEGILDGDMIIYKKSEIAKEGQIVVVLIDQHHATLKRISYKIKDMITLIPANLELKPRVYVPERVSVQGVYIGLVRTHV